MSSVPYRDATAPVLAQDECFQDGVIDAERWSSTVFLPLTMVAGGRAFAIRDRSALLDHLRALERKSRELQIATLRTHIRTVMQDAGDMSIIGVMRDRVSTDGAILGRTSITFAVLRVGEGWLINQVMFNDFRHDPSVVAQIFLRRSEY
ncbi:MAG: hypothetical protein AAFR84_15520 [Pseudomonadota bacterium]